MISRKVGISPKNDNYARLAEYIADAGNHSRQGGEKTLMCWCAGCLGDDDYQEGIAEVVDVQAMNTRTRQSKTYHLVISFRPEDEAKLTAELFKAIEERFSAALGYTEHQRHCGVHKNTANLHMHIAYNMIHPEKYTRHEPFRDYWTRDRVCRELEREYGFVVDNGRSKNEQRALGEKAALLEAHTGQQSFENYAKGYSEALLHALAGATDWQSFHEHVGLYGMAIKPHGNGLVFVNLHNPRHTVRASTVDRSLSLKKLETKFGPYLPARDLKNLPEQTRYEAVPLHRSPERGALYAEYRQGIEQRKTTLTAVKEQEERELGAIREKWAARRKELERLNIAKKNRRNLLQLARKHEAEEIAGAKVPLQRSRDAVREEVPFVSWNSFLQHKAEHGNETALAILRSRQETAELDRNAPPAATKDWSQHGKDQGTSSRAEIRAEFAARERAALENTQVSGRGKTRLLAVLRMEELAQEELQACKHRNEHMHGAAKTPLVAGYSHTVDRRGVVIFTLPGGSTIRDIGRELFFSAHDEAAREAALKYAQKKWGKAVHLEGNRLCRETQQEQQRGMVR